FRGWWGEGTPGEEYEDGVFNIYAVTALDAHTNYTAVIDRSSSLKSSCGHPTDYSGFYAWVDDDTGYKEFGQQNFVIEQTEEIAMDCYTAPASLTYNPPLPKVVTHITLGFQPARGLVAGDNVTVNLKGFTSGGGNGTSGDNY
ncbi:unnamed protein product, partial [Laminaria digitata]